ncbi:MAG: hypothetical protein HFI89_11105 [Lachnospiraceae bacterium]|nr:hypothetical protein [Lachnospiraceae bacterium]
MKKIKVNFVDFWPNFENDNVFLPILQKYYDVEISNTPDYIFGSVLGDSYLDYDCVRIFYTGENLCPDYNLYDYSIDYEYMEYGDRHFRYPNYIMWNEAFSGMVKKHLATEEEIRAKTGFCSFVYSNGKGNPARTQFFELLSQYKQVDAGGQLCNNIGVPEGIKDKLAFQTTHKFAIAFENSSHPGYTTEKLAEAFAAKTVPIYWGDPLVGLGFNEEAFINCHRYGSFEEVVEVVKRVDQDDALYRKMLLTPALKSQEYSQKETYKRLEQFLLNIFDQPLEQAYRRNRELWGKHYYESRLNQREYARMAGKIKKLVPHALIEQMKKRRR